MEKTNKTKHCHNCYFFNGEEGDKIQFCDDREDFVHEKWTCYRWREKMFYDENGDE